MHPRIPDAVTVLIALAAVAAGAWLGIETANYLWANDIGGIRNG